MTLGTGSGPCPAPIVCCRRSMGLRLRGWSAGRCAISCSARRRATSTRLSRGMHAGAPAGTRALAAAIEGGAREVAREVAARLEGEAVEHERFGTATVRADGFTVDLASTRRE